MTDEPIQNSVTNLIADLKQGDGDAAHQLWERYFPRLIRAAERRLRSASRRIADEEDVATSVFYSLCEGAKEGRFQQLQNRDDLWKLMVAITGMTSTDQIRKETSQKRGGGQVRGNSVFQPTGGNDNAGFDQFAEHAVSPEFLCELEEQQQRLFALLPDDDHRQIAKLRLEGFSHEEIAAAMDISVRSVARKFKVIRDAWVSEFQQQI